MTRFPGVVDLRISIFIFVHFCHSTILCCANSILLFTITYHNENHFIFFAGLVTEDLDNIIVQTRSCNRIANVR